MTKRVNAYCTADNLAPRLAVSGMVNRVQAYWRFAIAIIAMTHATSWSHLLTVGAFVSMRRIIRARSARRQETRGCAIFPRRQGGFGNEKSPARLRLRIPGGCVPLVRRRGRASCASRRRLAQPTPVLRRVDRGSGRRDGVALRRRHQRLWIRSNVGLPPLLLRHRSDGGGGSGGRCLEDGRGRSQALVAREESADVRGGARRRGKGALHHRRGRGYGGGSLPPRDRRRRAVRSPIPPDPRQLSAPSRDRGPRPPAAPSPRAGREDPLRALAEHLR